MHREQEILRCLNTDTKESIKFTIHRNKYSFSEWTVLFEFPCSRDPIICVNYDVNSAIDEALEQFKELIFVE